MNNKQKNQNPSPQKDKRINCTAKCTKNKENCLQIKNMRAELKAFKIKLENKVEEISQRKK